MNQLARSLLVVVQSCLKITLISTATINFLPPWQVKVQTDMQTSRAKTNSCFTVTTATATTILIVAIMSYGLSIFAYLHFLAGIFA